VVKEGKETARKSLSDGKGQVLIEHFEELIVLQLIKEKETGNNSGGKLRRPSRLRFLIVVFPWDE